MKTEPKRSPKKARVLLVDDHASVRQSIADVINHQPDLHVCGEADTVGRALQVIGASNPDIAVVDISLEGRNGIELIKDVRVQYPHLLVLVLSMHEESAYGARAIAAGAKGYVRKQESIQTLLAAIRQVLKGEQHLSETLAQQLLQGTGRAPAAARSLSIRELSDRELEVFELIGHGRRTRQIAEQLHLSERTVEAHRVNIREKLQLTDATELLQQAIEWVQAECK